MISILSQGNRVAAYVTHYIADRLTDVMWLPPHVMPGSTCFVIETSEKYMMNTVGAWIKIEGGNGAGGNGNNEEEKKQDYNDLENAPVINLVGTEEQPITFQRLGYGTYTISGNYRYADSDKETKVADTVFSIEVVDDNITQNKVVKVEDYEDGEYFVNTIIFAGDEYIEQKIFPGRVCDIPLVEY